MCFLSGKPLKVAGVSVCTLLARARFYLDFLRAKNHCQQKKHCCICAHYWEP